MIPYLLHVALLISVCLLFYKLLLQQETFYRLNRLVLVCCLALSFALPLIHLPPRWSLRDSSEQTVAIKPVETPLPTVVAPPAEATAKQPALKIVAAKAIQTVQQPTAATAPVWQQYVKWIVYLYWIGVGAFGLNLLLQLVVLLYQAYSRPFMRDGKFRIVELSGDKAPCSFANNIFINPEKYDWDTYSQILLHEKVHVEQRHSFDILLAEVVLVFQWFNPFAWMYRNEVESNLEFLTDDAVLNHKEVERSSYQMSLLKVSTPHLSLGITTNYNQSLLKKRIVMMNAKKSNINTMWKYFFLVPLLGCLACALNQPAAANAQTASNQAKVIKHEPGTRYNGDRTEGAWFATIKGEKINIEFKGGDDDHNWSNSSNFMLSEFSSLPKGEKGEFSLKREAGTVVFNGKFEGNEGYGRYKFTADKSFSDFLTKEGISDVEDGDMFAFFTINVKKDYVAMLHRNGFKELSKNNLIAMAALKVDEPYIRMWKDNGFDDLTPNQLVSGKALNIDHAYISEIRKAGYKDLTFNQLISFKAQHITGDYINGLRKAKIKDGKSAGEESLPTASEVSSFKAMNVSPAYVHGFEVAGYPDIPYRELTSMKALQITPEFANSFKAIGYPNLTVQNLVSFKSMNITPAFVKGYQDMGFKDLNPNNLTSLKAMNITADFIKGYEAVGYKNLTIHQLTTLKALNITPDYIRSFQALGYNDLTVNELSSLKALNVTESYIKSFEAAGYKHISANTLTSLKAQGITADFVKGFKDIGFDEVSLNELSSLKATGVTPLYITEMRGKGFNSKDLHKYIQLKTSFN